MLIAVPYIPPPRPEEKPPMVLNCKYQVKLDSQTYKCFTEEEYQKYEAQREKEATENAEAFGRFLKKWWWAILGLGVCMMVIIVKGMASPY